MTGSNYYVQENCFASSQMELRAGLAGMLPDDENNEDLARGTRQHKAMAEGKIDSLPEGERASVRAMQQQSKQAIASLGHEASTIIRESRLFLRDENYKEIDYSGQPDLVVYHPNTNPYIYFQDFKFAFKVDSVIREKWEAQRRAYAVLLYRHYGITSIAGDILTQFGKPSRENFDGIRLGTLYGRLRRVIQEHAKPNPPVTPGAWCQFCAGRLVCEQAHRAIPDSTLDISFRSDRLPSGVDGANVIRKLKRGIALAQEIIDWYEARIKEDPNFVGGEFSLKEGAEKGKIKDPLSALEALSKYFTMEEQAACVTVWPGKLKALIKDKTGLRKEAKEFLDQVLKGSIVYEKTKPVLVDNRDT